MSEEDAFEEEDENEDGYFIHLYYFLNQFYGKTSNSK